MSAWMCMHEWVRWFKDQTPCPLTALTPPRVGCMFQPKEPGFNPASSWSQAYCPNHPVTAPQSLTVHTLTHYSWCLNSPSMTCQPTASARTKSFSAWSLHLLKRWFVSGPEKVVQPGWGIPLANHSNMYRTIQSPKMACHWYHMLVMVYKYFLQFHFKFLCNPQQKCLLIKREGLTAREVSSSPQLWPVPAQISVPEFPLVAALSTDPCTDTDTDIIGVFSLDTCCPCTHCLRTQSSIWKPTGRHFHI